MPEASGHPLRVLRNIARDDSLVACRFRRLLLRQRDKVCINIEKILIISFILPQ